MDIIREEDEGGHSRRLSQIDQGGDGDSDSDYKDDDSSEYEISRIGTHTMPHN